MQLHFRTRLIAAIAVIIFFASCSKTNKQGRMVPKEAGFVMHINGKSLSGKVNMEELKQMDFYKQLNEEMMADSNQSELMKRLNTYNTNSGIDSLSDFIFFVDNSNPAASHLVLEAGLKDAKAFESFLKNVYPEGSISKDGDVQVMGIKNKVVITWNNEKIIAGFRGPANRFGDNYPEVVTTEDVNNIPELASSCKKMYALKEDSSMAKDEKFTDLVNTDGDLHAWINTEKLMGNLPQMGMLSMMKMDKFLTGNISTLTLNFENGKIAIKSKGYAGKELSDVLKKYSGGSINTDMLKNIPSQDVVGVLALHFKPEGLKELVKLSGMDGFADILLAQQGISLDDFFKANKGDVMFAVSDLTMKKDSVHFPGVNGKTESFATETPDAKFIFSAAINNKDAFNKLINYAKKESGDGMGLDKISYNTNKEYFAIGNSPDYVSKFLAGGKADLPFLSKISGNPVGGYVDLQKVMKVFATESNKDSISKKIMDESLKTWESVTLTGGDYSGGGLNQLLEVNMVDKGTNSLKQLFKYGLTMASLEKEREKSYNTPIVDEVKVKPEVKKDNKPVIAHPKVKRK